MKITKEDVIKIEHEIIDEDDEIRRQLILYYHGAHHLKYRHCKNEMEAEEE